MNSKHADDLLDKQRTGIADWHQKYIDAFDSINSLQVALAEARDNNRKVVCSYCGEVSEFIDRETMLTNLVAHMEKCPTHPLNRVTEIVDHETAELEQKLAEVEAERDAVRAALTASQEERERFRAALTAINEIRNSMVGRQALHFSLHAYPLVAALNAAGFKGLEFEAARQQEISRDDHAKALEEAIDRLHRYVHSIASVTECGNCDEVEALIGVGNVSS